MIYYRDPACADIVFLGFTSISPPEKVHSIVNLGGIVKTLRIVNLLSRSIFSTAGSFGDVGVGFWQDGFFVDFDFWAAGFFSRILSPDFFSSFLWGKSAQKNPPPGKAPAKSSKKFFSTKIPDTFLQRGRTFVMRNC